MKSRIAAALLGATLLLSAGGCNFLELDLEDALRPPKTMGDEAEIEQLIAQSANDGYTLKYPKNGNYRSAIIMQDLDSDGTAEAIAFFRGKDETTRLHMLVMYEKDGEWKISGDFVTETTDVDCVDFAKVTGTETLDILAGYTTYSPSAGFLTCYSYKNGETTSVSAGQSYSAFYCGSLDRTDRSEVIIFSLYNADTEAKATMLEYNSDKRTLYAKSSVAMDPGVVKIRSATFGVLQDDVRGIAVDGAYADEQLTTQVIYYNRDLAVLRNPLYHDKIKNPTLRSLEVYAEDVNNDKIIDIPTVEKLPHASADTANLIADRVTRNNFNVSRESLVHTDDYVLNIPCNYSVRIPDSWEDGSYTAVQENKATRFYEWEDQESGALIFEIRAFDVATWEQGKDTDEYTLIYRNNRYAYALRNNTDEDSPFKLTDNEIKTSFSLLSEEG